LLALLCNLHQCKRSITVLTRQTRQVVSAIKQSTSLDDYGFLPRPGKVLKVAK
jgi:hypothetical protein